MGALQYGARENIEHLAASMAPIEWKVVFAGLVGLLGLRQGMAAGAAQAQWVQKTQQEFIAFFKTHKELDWELESCFFSKIVIFLDNDPKAGMSINFLFIS